MFGQKHKGIKPLLRLIAIEGGKDINEQGWISIMIFSLVILNSGIFFQIYLAA